LPTSLSPPFVDATKIDDLVKKALKAVKIVPQADDFYGPEWLARNDEFPGKHAPFSGFRVSSDGTI